MHYTIRSDMIDVSPSHQAKLIRLMQLFQAALRFAYNRYLEGMSKTELVHLLQKMFIPNARYCQWAADKAQATIASQTELLPLYLQETEEKLTKSRQKLAYCQNDEKKAAQEARIKKQGK